MSKKDIFTKKNITSDGKNAIFYGDISRKYDCFAQEIINRIDDESYEKATKDVAEIERKIKLIDGYSKGYVERVLNFKNKE